MYAVSENQEYLMVGKNVIVLGGGSYRSSSMWPAAARYGIKVCLVDTEPTHPSSDIVHCYLYYDFSDHTKDHDHALKIIDMINDQGIVADGCLTFVDECTPLAALICEKLGLRGSSYEGTVIANSKTKTQNTLSMRIKGQPNKYQTDKFCTTSFHLTKESDCDLLPESFQFPAMLKLDNGARAVGACVVNSRTEMKSKFNDVTSTLCSESDFKGIGLCLGNSMTTMELYKGTEHNIDVVLYDKQLVCAFISDSGEVRRPYFLGTAKRMPSILNENQLTRLKDVAVKCCLAIGLTDGTFNVEIIITPDGPKLIEINARTGGYTLTTWLEKLYGVDIMLYAMMIACGIKPAVPDLTVNKIIMGALVIPSLHAHLQKECYFKDKLCQMIENEDVIYVHSRKVQEKATAYEDPFGIIGVIGASSKETKEKLMSVCKALEIDQEDYRIERFIRDF